MYSQDELKSVHGFIRSTGENNLKNMKGKLKEYKSLDYAMVKSIEENTINVKIELLQQ